MIPEDRRQEAARVKIRATATRRGTAGQQVAVLAVGLSALLGLLLM